MNKTKLYLFLLLCCGSIAGAQNLIPNPSFEYYSSCPVGPRSGAAGLVICNDWVSANWSPDYYNACDTGGSVCVPANLMGYQPAQDGSAYIGMFAYNLLGTGDYSEYIMAQLTAPLEKDTPYVVTIHVSLADSSMYAVDDLAVLFDTYGQPAQSPFENLAASPTLAFTSLGVISDTANWTTLTKIYIPDSAYTYFIFGDFGNQYEVDTIRRPGHTRQAAYYYVDNISVQKVSYTGVPQVAAAVNDCLVYPNPFTETTTLTFNNPSAASASLSIYNMQGQLMRSIEDITGNQVTVERDGLAAGMYFYRLQSDKGVIGQGKMTVK